MRITRRDFIKYVSASAAALGLAELQIAKLTEALANPSTTAPRVLWLQGATCTGCTMTITQMFGPHVPPSALGITPVGLAMDLVDTAFDPPAATTVDDVVVDFIDLQYQQTVMTAAGDLAAQHLKSFYPGDPLAIPPIPPGSNAGRAFVLIVEGTILANEFATMAYDRTVGDEIPVGEAVANLAASADCLAVIALGQCAAFGNWPAARNQKASGTDYARTQGLPVTSFLATRGISKTVVNLSGCPPQPEVFLLTVADFLTGSLTFINDGTNRPSPYYDHTLHWANGYAVDDPAFQGCPRFYDYKGWDPVTGQDRPPKFATKRGDDGCLIMIGCKGPSTKTPCTVYQYLGKRSFCTKSSTPCQGCHEKGYPDKFSPYLEY